MSFRLSYRAPIDIELFCPRSRVLMLQGFFQ